MQTSIAVNIKKKKGLKIFHCTNVNVLQVNKQKNLLFPNQLKNRQFLYINKSNCAKLCRFYRHCVLQLTIVKYFFLNISK